MGSGICVTRDKSRTHLLDVTACDARGVVVPPTAQRSLGMDAFEGE